MICICTEPWHEMVCQKGCLEQVPCRSAGAYMSTALEAPCMEGPACRLHTGKRIPGDIHTRLPLQLWAAPAHITGWMAFSMKYRSFMQALCCRKATQQQSPQTTCPSSYGPFQPTLQAGWAPAWPLPAFSRLWAQQTALKERPLQALRLSGSQRMASVLQVDLWCALPDPH